jgi:hypothetical protein
VIFACLARSFRAKAGPRSAVTCGYPRPSTVICGFDFNLQPCPTTSAHLSEIEIRKSKFKNPAISTHLHPSPPNSHSSPPILFYPGFESRFGFKQRLLLGTFARRPSCSGVVYAGDQVDGKKMGQEDGRCGIRGVGLGLRLRRRGGQGFM